MFLLISSVISEENELTNSEEIQAIQLKKKKAKVFIRHLTQKDI